MVTWGQIVVIGIFILGSIVTVAICDTAIIKEIKKLRKAIKQVCVLLVNKNEEE